MAAGRKTGGRRPGSVNKLTLGVRERLAALGCDPVEGLARIAMAPGTDPALAARILADLLPFIAPKMAAVTIETILPPGPFPNLVIGFLPKKETPPQ